MHSISSTCAALSNARGTCGAASAAARPLSPPSAKTTGGATRARTSSANRSRKAPSSGAADAGSADPAAADTAAERAHCAAAARSSASWGTSTAECGEPRGKPSRCGSTKP